MLISVQGATGKGKGVYSPVFCVCPFDSFHTLHLESAGSSPAREKALWVIEYLGTFRFLVRRMTVPFLIKTG